MQILIIIDFLAHTQRVKMYVRVQYLWSGVFVNAQTAQMPAK